MIAIFLPWIEWRQRFSVAGVDFMPLSEAHAALPNERQQQALTTYASVYYSPEAVEETLRTAREFRAAIDAGEDLVVAARDVVAPSPLQPMIVLVEDREQATRAVNAIDALMFATVIENGVFAANATTFHSHQLDLGRGPATFLGEMRPRMHGQDTNSFALDSRVDMRPRHAGRYHGAGNLAFATALARALENPQGGYLKRALQTLRLAMSESPDLTPDLQHSLFAKAASLAMYREGLKGDYAKVLEPVVDAMFKPCFRGRRKGPTRVWLVKAWTAVRLERNAFWHPHGDRVSTEPFSQAKQLLVAPMMIALRMVYALVIARLLELGELDPTSELVHDVPAVASWIASLGPRQQRNLAVPELPADSDDVAARARFAHDMMEWNEAARRASHWFDYRGEERMQAGIREAVRGLRARRRATAPAS